MEYYYDVLLNFQENYCMFYEWDKEDTIEFVKKIPLFHVDGETLINMINKKIVVKKDFLKKIENKTKLKQNKYLEYTAIFGDGKNSICLEFDKDGNVINKSSLILDDELNINEFMYNINQIKIDYEIKGKEIFRKDTRQDLKIKKILRLEINDMYENKEFSKLKFIYLEWFNELINDLEKMRDNMLNKLNKELTEKEYEIYELIKLSYNNV